MTGWHHDAVSPTRPFTFAFYVLSDPEVKWYNAALVHIIGGIAVRLRTHLVASALAGHPALPARAAAPCCTFAGVAVDLDHYLLYALRSGDWNPFGALR